MLKKVNRLAKSKDIQIAFAKGRTFFNPYFSLKAHHALGVKRFTVVVSTKVYKNAVDRNRLKRQVREFIRNNLNNLKFGNYVIVAKPAIAEKGDALVQRAIKEILFNIFL